MQVYECPKEVPAPEIDFRNFDLAKLQAAEAEHSAKLKAHMIGLGYKGQHTGLVLSVPFADGCAQYMIAESAKKTVLIHLPYGDAWHSPDVKFLPKKEVLRRVAQRSAVNKLFAAKAAK